MIEINKDIILYEIIPYLSLSDFYVLPLVFNNIKLKEIFEVFWKTFQEDFKKSQIFGINNNTNIGYIKTLPFWNGYSDDLSEFERKCGWFFYSKAHYNYFKVTVIQGCLQTWSLNLPYYWLIRNQIIIIENSLNLIYI
jgi:hypothetical protein